MLNPVTALSNSMHNAYMASLVPPTKDQFEQIAQVQAEREDENRKKTKGQRHLAVTEAVANGQAHDAAARMIQKTFRGYRARREMDGYSLNPTSRWITVIRDAQFREANRPRPLSESATAPAPDNEADARPISSPKARRNWKRVGMVAMRVGHDDSDSESDLESDSESESRSEHSDKPHAEKVTAQKAKRRADKARRKVEARTMGLQYFLEMIDLKHRYGSNLRIYHEEWKRSEAQENFFYWLDHGAGRNIELESCSRDQLEREQVRYLSREERQYYLVNVDTDGRLCWAKNGARIDTTEQFRDSIHGIVPVGDATPMFKPTASPPADESHESRSSSSTENERAREADRAAKYATPEFDNASGLKKMRHLTVSTLIDKLLRKSVRKNTWIFVADTSFRLYVGIKDSGAFQHSSFLQGRRISAAGLIKIQNGRLQSLSPLSGHYRPPSSNFRAFVQSLKAEGVDMSRMTVSKSYAILIGLETYVRTQKKSKEFVDRLLRTKERSINARPVQRPMKTFNTK